MGCREKLAGTVAEWAGSVKQGCIAEQWRLSADWQEKGLLLTKLPDFLPEKSELCEPENNIV